MNNNEASQNHDDNDEDDLLCSSLLLSYYLTPLDSATKKSSAMKKEIPSETKSEVGLMSVKAVKSCVETPDAIKSTVKNITTDNNDTTDKQKENIVIDMLNDDDSEDSDGELTLFDLLQKKGPCRVVSSLQSATRNSIVCNINSLLAQAQDQDTNDDATVIDLTESSSVDEKNETCVVNKVEKDKNMASSPPEEYQSSCKTWYTPTADIGGNIDGKSGENGFVDEPLVNFASSSASNDDKSCFICGLELGSLKSRLSHIKRCSKKYGVSVKDLGCDVVVEEDDEGDCNMTGSDEYLLDVTSTSAQVCTPSPPIASASILSTPLTATIVNPYKRKSISESATKSPNVRTSTELLMAGAKRAAKLAKVGIDTSQLGDLTTFAKQKMVPKLNSKVEATRDRQYNYKYLPSYKKIPYTDFVVDGFHYAPVAKTRNFFLTHFHADHYGGITKQWNNGIIYCSTITASLVNTQLRVEECYLHPLPMLQPIKIQSNSQQVLVTLIDANHCPGAIMFLFQIGNRYILHVGDFRWSRSVMQKQLPLKPFFDKTLQLEQLFFDTTYCKSKYSLPSQQEAIDATIRVVQEQFRQCQPPNILLVFGSYTIGKERIYMAVAEHLNVKVYVDNRRYRILSQLEWPKSQLDRLTTNPTETYLWVVPLGHITMQRLPSYKHLKTRYIEKTFDRVVGFRPTGWTHSPNKKSSGIVSTVEKNNIVVCGVPYSEHSSFPELVDCLRCLQPKKITPTVAVRSTKQQLDLLNEALQEGRY